MILLSFDKTMELLMCIKEMKGRVKVVFFVHLNIQEKGLKLYNASCEIFKCHMTWF